MFDEAGAVSCVTQNAIDVTDLYRFNVSTHKYALAQGLRQLPQSAGALRIAVTGYGQESDRTQTRLAGLTIIWSNRSICKACLRYLTSSPPPPRRSCSRPHPAPAGGIEGAEELECIGIALLAIARQRPPHHGVETGSQARRDM